jgi:hypothetical protein
MTGMLGGEAVALDDENFDPVRGPLLVRGAIPPKRADQTTVTFITDTEARPARRSRPCHPYREL